MGNKTMENSAHSTADVASMLSPGSPPPSTHRPIKIASSYVDSFVVCGQVASGEWRRFTLSEDGGIVPKFIGHRVMVEIRVERQSDLNHVEVAAGVYRLLTPGCVNHGSPASPTEAFGVKTVHGHGPAIATVTDIVRFCDALNLACQREATSYVIAELAEKGVCIGLRSPKRIQECKGAFMIAEALSQGALDSDRDTLCMVGDDLLFLIEKAGAELGIEA